MGERQLMQSNLKHYQDTHTQRERERERERERDRERVKHSSSIKVI